MDNKETQKDNKTTQKKVVAKKEPKKKVKENKVNDEIIKLKEELGLEKEKSMRIQAEMMNFKRRKEEEVASIKKYANEDILKKLLTSVDNFERALAFENKANEEIYKGIKMIYSNILNILSENEVTEIDALNQEFDPAIHQAVLTEAKEGVEAGIVIEVMLKGYKYKDRVLRPAMVKVSE